MTMTERVIEDSDDDGDALSASQSPQKVDAVVEAKAGQIGSGAAQKSSSSTDPMAFQKIYEQNLGILDNADPDDPPSSVPFPTIEDLVHNHAPHMSTSPVSAKKPKRSKTATGSSLTSVSEPAVSNKKVKRTKSTSNIETLTQVTTPRKSAAIDKIATGEEANDIWDFPSSASNGPTSALQIQSRNSVKEKRTYGKQKLRRAKTTDFSSSKSNDWTVPETAQDDASPQLLGYQPTNSAEEMSPIRPRAKKHRSRSSVNQDAISKVIARIPETLTSSDPPTSNEILLHMITSANPPSVQVPGSTSEQTWQVAQTSTNVAASSVRQEQHPSNENSNSHTQSIQPGSRISIMIPNSMTSSQKQQYQFIDSVSTALHGTPQPGTLETIRHSIASSVMNGIIVDSSQDLHTEQSPLRHTVTSILATEDPESPPVVSSSRRTKRARSFSVSEQPTESQSNTQSTRSSKKLRRNKSMGHRDPPSSSQHSMDELSLPPTDAHTNAATPNAKRTRYRKLSLSNNTTIVEAQLLSDHVEIPYEKYQPRLSRKRALSSTFEHVSLQRETHARKNKTRRTKSSIATSEPRLSDKGFVKSLLDQVNSGGYVPDLSQQDEDRNEEGVRTETSLDENNFNIDRALPLPVESTGSVALEDSSKGCLHNEAVIVSQVQIQSVECPAADLQPQPEVEVTKGKRGRPKKTLAAPSKSTQVPALQTLHDTETPSTIDARTNGYCAVEHNETIISPNEVLPKTNDSVEVLTGKPAPKRRGRPRTKTMPVFSSERIYSDDEEPVLISVRQPGTTRTTSNQLPETPKLQEVSANPSQSPNWSQNAKSSSADKVRKEAETSGANEKTMSVEKGKTLLETPSKNLEKGPEKHSPLGSGKVPLRVGLSRRGVPSLLKIKPKVKP